MRHPKEIISEFLQRSQTAIDSYKALTKLGGELLTKLCNTMIELGYAQGMSWGVLQDNLLVKKLVKEKLMRKRLEATGEVYGCFESIESIVQEFKKYTALLTHELESHNNYQPLLKLVSTDVLASYANEIVSYLESDLKVKKNTIGDLLSRDNFPHDHLIVYVAAWSMMPLLNLRRLDDIVTVLKLELSK